MVTRHRTPTIFNIYMVDVLCCALGCVILLWQLNYHEAQEQGSVADETAKKLDASQAKLTDTQKLLTAAEQRIASLSADLTSSQSALSKTQKNEALVRVQLEDMRKERNKIEALAIITKKEYDETRAALDVANTLITNLRVDVKSLEQKSNLTASELAAKIRDHGDLLKKMNSAADLLRNMERSLELKQKDALVAAKNTDALLAQLKKAEERALTGDKNNTDLQKQVKDYQAKLTAAEIRVALLEKDATAGRKNLVDLTQRFQDMFKAQEALGQRLLVSSKDLVDARKLIDSLGEEKLTLMKRAQAIQMASDNRFAGIQLTGRNVLFLVDMSGSMELIDTGTPEPDKWPLVCDTIGHLMQSLLDVKNYQVILFSDKVRYPLGKEGQWLEYYPQSSKKATVDGLKAVKPYGETNMYAAFQEAFKFRGQGLDTIYVISDGLPNAGPGLPTGKTLTEAQKTEHLSKSIRQNMRTTWNLPSEGRRVRINTIGFFFESPDVGAFLWALARENDGSFVGMSKP